jgi:hypothetical protein
MNSKQRRHAGRVTPKSTLKAPKKFIINNALEPKSEWDDWNDIRDGCRDLSNPKHIYKHIHKKVVKVKQINARQKKKLLLRKRKKSGKSKETRLRQ